MVVQQHTVTDEEFDRFIALPQNINRTFELIGGSIVEVVSNNYASEIGALFVAVLVTFVRPRNLGRVTGADGGYRVSGERYIPDAAFISKAKQPDPSHDAYNPNAPDLAVEVLSPGNTPAEIRVKIANYLNAGTVLWVVDPDVPQVEVYTPGEPVKIIGIDGVLDGGAVLPGFTLAIRDIFPAE